jgi:hypothetical protein
VGGFRNVGFGGTLLLLLRLDRFFGCVVHFGRDCPTTDPPAAWSQLQLHFFEHGTAVCSCV